MEARSLSIGYRQGPRLAQVLLDVSLDLVAGRIKGLAGESGSGKSTLALALMGYRPAGQVTLDGHVKFEGGRITGASVKRLQALWGSRLAYLPQDTARSLNPALTIERHFIDSLRKHRIGDGHWAERTREWLGRVSIPDPERAAKRHPHQFSGGQQQRIALALALSLEPEVLILDEPTTGLDVVTQASVNRLIIDLARQLGVATLYVSHNLALLATICDELAIMYGGQIVETGPAKDVYFRPAHPYTTALVAAVPSIEARTPPRGIPGLPRPTVALDECCFLERCPWAADQCRQPIPLLPVGEDRDARCVRLEEVAWSDRVRAAAVADVESRPGSVSAVLSVLNLTCAFPRPGSREHLVAVDNVSFEVMPGRTLGVAGESGSGKSTLLGAIAGLIRPAGGEIRLHAELVRGLAGARPASVRRALQIVFQNPDATLNPRHTIEQSLERPLRLFRSGLKAAERRERIVEMIGRVRLSPDLLTRYPSRLSGGQRQRVAIARALLAEPEVLLCDEITSALDVSVQASILELLIELRQAQALAMVFVTHDLGVLRAIADDVVVMQNGAIRESGKADDVLTRPRDSYTIALIDSIPKPGPGSDRSSERIAT